MFAIAGIVLILWAFLLFDWQLYGVQPHVVRPRPLQWELIRIATEKDPKQLSWMLGASILMSPHLDLVESPTRRAWGKAIDLLTGRTDYSIVESRAWVLHGHLKADRADAFLAELQKLWNEAGERPDAALNNVRWWNKVYEIILWIAAPAMLATLGVALVTMSWIGRIPRLRAASGESGDPSA